MHSFFALTVALAALTSNVLAASQTLTKPPIDPPFDTGLQQADLKKELPSQPYTWSAWARDWVPKACYDEARWNNLEAADFEVREIKYHDCSATWTVCRHKQHTTSWGDIAKVGTRLVVHL